MLSSQHEALLPSVAIEPIALTPQSQRVTLPCPEIACFAMLSRLSRGIRERLVRFQKWTLAETDWQLLHNASWFSLCFRHLQ